MRLRMDESLLTSEFLLSELNHYSIGFIHQVDDDGDVSNYLSLGGTTSNICFRFISLQRFLAAILFVSTFASEYHCLLMQF